MAPAGAGRVRQGGAGLGPARPGRVSSGRVSSGDAAARQALAHIALVGILAVMDNLDLRSGCELVTTSREFLTVNADGSRTPLEVSQAQEEMHSAISTAADHGLVFSSPVRLVAGDALARLAQRGLV